MDINLLTKLKLFESRFPHWHYIFSKHTGDGGHVGKPPYFCRLSSPEYTAGFGFSGQTSPAWGNTLEEAFDNAYVSMFGAAQ